MSLTSTRVMLALLLGLLVTAAHASPKATQELNAVLAKKVNNDHGAELFRTCAACHGVSGGGSANGDVPRIAGQHFEVIVRQLVDYRNDARWDIRMEHYAGRQLLDDPQAIADVAGYISQLNGEVSRNRGNGELTRHGAEVYAAKCAQCHGAMGEGSAADRVPRLAGQHYAYLLRQMYDAVDGRRPNFSASHVRLLAKLEHDDFVGVADFLSRSDWTGPVAQLSRVR